MNKLIRLHAFDGDPMPNDEHWCATCSTDTLRTVCGYALDACADYRADTKTVQRGGITCPACIEVIKQIKDIKL